jgi:predicted unusual protein kinase regulating ubiquinone biosynthesis (AarF/ABC1/UbiB family)
MKLSKIGKAIQFSKIGITTFALKKFNQEAGKQYLLQELSKMPGIPAKMGQVLLMKYDQAPSEKTTPRAFPLEWVKHHIQSESPKLAEQIEFIDENAFTASLGQVHRAILKDHSEIAIKVRYPGIENEIQEQLDLMMAVFKKAPTPSGMKIDTEDYGSFLKDFFKEEMNYRKEAESQNRFRDFWISDSRFVIPKIFLDFTTSSLLVQDFESSTSLSTIDDFSPEERDYYYHAMKDFFIHGLLNFGVVHTDLHEKNWGLRREKRQLVFYDFGATIHLSTEFKMALISLSMMNKATPSEYLKTFEVLGFDLKKMSEIQETLPELCEILFEPIRQKENWNPHQWNLQKRVNDLLSSKKWNFRTAGPPWFLLFIRGLNGWIHALKTLHKPIPVLVETTLASTKLFIRVMENSKIKADLEFPSHSVDQLEDLIPDLALETIKKNGIQLTQIIEQVKKSNYSPQILFETGSSEKSYRVWLA